MVKQPMGTKESTIGATKVENRILTFYVDAALFSSGSRGVSDDSDIENFRFQELSKTFHFKRADHE